MKALTKTDFNFPGQKSVYHGKVRDVYNINGEQLVMVRTGNSPLPTQWLQWEYSAKVSR